MSQSHPFAVASHLPAETCRIFVQLRCCPGDGSGPCTKRGTGVLAKERPGCRRDCLRTLASPVKVGRQPEARTGSQAQIKASPRARMRRCTRSSGTHCHRASADASTVRRIAVLDSSLPEARHTGQATRPRGRREPRPTCKPASAGHRSCHGALEEPTARPERCADSRNRRARMTS